MWLRRRPRLGLFEGYGVELEYMIVDRDSLDVRPVADCVMMDVAGAPESEVERGAIAWSNELALHVLELKTNGPSRTLSGLADAFLADVRGLNRLLERHGARLLPGGMHPWMDPEKELALWPHEYASVYAAYDRIFGCRDHGWANVQSMHLNLPFAGDAEFGRLHAAVRLVLPILPALAASSPVVGGAHTAQLDNRLAYYRDHARRVPSVTGLVIPEAVFSRADYQRQVLAPIYADLASLDDEGLLRAEWVNARGAIARFDRDAIEIRVVDVQETPAADLAIAAAAAAVVRGLVEGAFAPERVQRRWEPGPLAAILADVARDGEEARIRDRAYLDLFGVGWSASPRAGDLWRHLLERTLARQPGHGEWEPALDVILGEGPLARRLLRRLDGDYRAESLRAVWSALADCLAEGRLLRA